MSKKVQSIFIVNASPIKKPSKDLKARIIKEVPTATFISTFAKSTRAGIIKNPPPEPIHSVIDPTVNPSNKIKG